MEITQTHNLFQNGKNKKNVNCNFFYPRSTCPCVPDRIGIWKCLFLRGRKKRSTRKKTSRSKGEKQKQSQPSCGVHTKIRTRATLVGGEWSDTLTNAPPLLPIMAAILHVLYFCLFVFFFSCLYFRVLPSLDHRLYVKSSN